MQIFLTKNQEVKYCRVRHYKGTEADKPKFFYHQQTREYAETQAEKAGQKPFNQSVSSKAVAIGEKPITDQTGQVKGQEESGSNLKNECGCSLAWFCPALEISPLTRFFADNFPFFVLYLFVK